MSQPFHSSRARALEPRWEPVLGLSVQFQVANGSETFGTYPRRTAGALGRAPWVRGALGSSRQKWPKWLISSSYRPSKTPSEQFSSHFLQFEALSSNLCSFESISRGLSTCTVPQHGEYSKFMTMTNVLAQAHSTTNPPSTARGQKSEHAVVRVGAQVARRVEHDGVKVDPESRAERIVPTRHMIVSKLRRKARRSEYGSGTRPFASGVCFRGHCSRSAGRAQCGGWSIALAPAIGRGER